MRHQRNKIVRILLSQAKSTTYAMSHGALNDRKINIPFILQVAALLAAFTCRRAAN
ncbi:hypothetical protein [Photorhabdus australis]|uniref:hypothetical protein n=1 Tax=Photorhabdus australis TaxID=286156 RepID=UPI0030DDC85B